MQEECWTEQFREILNRPPPAVPEKEEISKAIMSLKNSKAPGHNNLNTELFMADPELAATILQTLFAAIWEEEPSD